MKKKVNKQLDMALKLQGLIDTGKKYKYLGMRVDLLIKEELYDSFIKSIENI